jgi:methyltransferase (TIGR00027 family)
MSNKTVEQTPSQTALFVALRRTIAHKQYHNQRFGPDYLAEIFLPASYRFLLKFATVRANTKNKLAAFMPGMNEYIIARTALFDSLFEDALQERISQIVLLGAGYDSRAYRFAKLNGGTKIYELDASPTQNRKIQCLKAAHISIPAEVHFIPINFITESLSDVLQKAGYKNQDKTLFLWEGVSYYLDREAVQQTLSFVSRCSNRDSAIAFDYMITVSDEDLRAYYGASELMESMKEYHANEELMFSIRLGEVKSFLAGNHLCMVEHLENQEIERMYLMDIDGSLIGRMLGIFEFVRA